MPRLEDNIAAAVAAIGTEHVGIVWGIATHPWQTAEDRDAFLQAITSSEG